MTAYETAVEKNKNEPETYVKMAKIWSSSKKYDLATEKLESAIAIAPDYALAYKDLYVHFECRGHNLLPHLVLHRELGQFVLKSCR